MPGAAPPRAGCVTRPTVLRAQRRARRAACASRGARHDAGDRGERVAPPAGGRAVVAKRTTSTQRDGAKRLPPPSGVNCIVFSSRLASCVGIGPSFVRDARGSHAAARSTTAPRPPAGVHCAVLELRLCTNVQRPSCTNIQYAGRCAGHAADSAGRAPAETSHVSSVRSLGVVLTRSAVSRGNSAYFNSKETVT